MRVPRDCVPWRCFIQHGHEAIRALHDAGWSDSKIKSLDHSVNIRPTEDTTIDNCQSIKLEKIETEKFCMKNGTVTVRDLFLSIKVILLERGETILLPWKQFKELKGSEAATASHKAGWLACELDQLDRDFAKKRPSLRIEPENHSLHEKCSAAMEDNAGNRAITSNNQIERIHWVFQPWKRFSSTSERKG